MIIWLTGQPGSGKTTLANSLISKLSDETNDIKIINLALKLDRYLQYLKINILY